MPFWLRLIASCNFGIFCVYLQVFGVKCIDFVTAWEHAEKYTRAVQPENAENNRVVTIIQTLIIWINAKNAKVCRQMHVAIRYLSQ